MLTHAVLSLLSSTGWPSCIRVTFSSYCIATNLLYIVLGQAGRSGGAYEFAHSFCQRCAAAADRDATTG